MLIARRKLWRRKCAFGTFLAEFHAALALLPLLLRLALALAETATGYRRALADLFRFFRLIGTLSLAVINC